MASDDKKTKTILAPKSEAAVKAMIVVTHEMGFARHVADRVVFMDKGEIPEEAPSEQFFIAPATLRAQEFLSKLPSH